MMKLYLKYVHLCTTHLYRQLCLICLDASSLLTVELVLTTTAMAVMMAILSGQSGWLDDYRWVKVGNYTALTHCV